MALTRSRDAGFAFTTGSRFRTGFGCWFLSSCRAIENRNAAGSTGSCSPRFGELPEDLTRAQGKTLRPRTLEEFIQYDVAKVPRYPFGLMWVRWLLGLPGRPGDPAPELSSQRREISRAARGAGRVAYVEHRPVEVIPIEDKQENLIDVRPCFRRVTIGFDDAKLDVVIRGVTKERPISPVPKKRDEEQLHKCEVEEAVAMAPTCFYPSEPAKLSPLEALLGGLGVVVCEEVTN